MLERLRRGPWPLVVVAVAVTPKCLLCLVAYAGLGTALGLGGRELCGATGEAAAGPVVALALLVAVVGGLFLWRITAGWRARVR